MRYYSHLKYVAVELTNICTLKCKEINKMKHSSKYYLQKARDAFLEEKSEEDAISLEDKWGVLVSTRKREK